MGSDRGKAAPRELLPSELVVLKAKLLTSMGITDSIRTRYNTRAGRLGWPELSLDEVLESYREASAGRRNSRGYPSRSQDSEPQ